MNLLSTYQSRTLVFCCLSVDGMLCTTLVEVNVFSGTVIIISTSTHVPQIF